MKRSTKIISVGILSISVVTGAAAYGKHKFGNHEARAAHMVAYITDELNLDTTQAQALDALKDQVISKATTLRGEFSPMREEISSLISAEQFDQAQALELINANAAAMTAAAPELVNAMGVFLDGLDATQKAEILEFMQKHQTHHRRGPRGRDHSNRDE